MKKFKTSEELISILLKNGLEETTKDNLPLHYSNLIKDGYDPHKVKREFSYNGKPVLLFDYVCINSKIKNIRNGYRSEAELSIDEVKSIIVFSKLPYQTVNGLYRSGQTEITTLYKTYYYIKEHPEFTKSKNKFRNDLIVKEFESVHI